MRFTISCCILVLFLIVSFSVTVDAHPHRLGNLDHGSSLESYQTELDFTTENYTKGLHNKNTKTVKKNTAKKDSINKINIHNTDSVIMKKIIKINKKNNKTNNK